MDDPCEQAAKTATLALLTARNCPREAIPAALEWLETHVLPDGPLDCLDEIDEAIHIACSMHETAPMPTIEQQVEAMNIVLDRRLSNWSGEIREVSDKIAGPPEREGDRADGDGWNQ